MDELAAALDRVAIETRFSGAVRVDRGDDSWARAYGLANRAQEVANTTETRFAVASGTKGFTALTIMSLVEEGRLELSTTARALLGADLPLVGDDVTVEHLLAHRSGIGDYIDEDAGHDIADYVLSVPVHELATTADYLRVLGEHPTVNAPDERFAYNNSGYVVLALLAERAGAAPFPELVGQRVCAPASMRRTAFLRSDELPGDAAIGYLGVDGLRTNVLHLPVLGSGDGGVYSTAADLHAFWAALFARRIVSMDSVAAMVRPRSDVPSHALRYGLGFWLRQSGDGVILEGYDAGVSFRSVHEPGRNVTHTVLSNTSEGAWPVARLLEDRVGSQR